MTDEPAAYREKPPTAAVCAGRLSRRRAVAFLVLMPTAALLSACATVKNDNTRNQRQPTYKNGRRGRGGPGSR
jgi:hypothetical protein